MTSNLEKLRDYSSLFSRKHGVSWLKKDFNSVKARIKLYDPHIVNISNITYLDYLKKVYKTIETKYPNEYVIKNSFINHSLINEIKELNSVVYSEFRVGKSVVDLAMFNGISKAFEIKSEFDTPNRLEGQLKDYKKIFNEVYIIVPKIKIDLYLNFDDTSGVIAFQSNSTEKDKFELIRKPKTVNQLDFNEIMNILRTNEYKELVNTFYGSLPPMTSFTQFEICKELISKIPTVELSRMFLALMKKRKENTFLSKRIHKEFNQLSLALNFNRYEHNKVVTNLKETIKL